MIGVLQLIDEYPGAVNRDLMDVGHRLRDLEDEDSGLLLIDVLDMVEHAHESSALYRATNGSDAGWGLQEQLTAMVADAMNARLWQEGGGKGRRPQPIPRPGVSKQETKTYKPDTLSTVTEMDAWLEARRAKN